MASSTDTSIKKLAIRGAIWTLAGYGASQILRFGSNLILTRLLVPELFGLMSLVYVFIAALHMFSDTGVGISIVQNKRGDEPAFLNTAWTIQVVRGVILWVVCVGLAYPASQFYNEPRIAWLLPIVGLTTVISGFTSTAIFTLNRHLSVKELAVFELSGQLVGTIVTIVWALYQPTVWALVASGLISTVYQVCFSYWVAKGKLNYFTWDKTAAHELLSFGAWIFLSTAMTFFGEQADRLILSKLLGFTLLGIYNIALTFADLPRAITIALSSKVVMPAFAKIADEPRPVIKGKLRNQRKRVLGIMALGLALLASFGDIIIETLYDQRYIDAAWMLPILTLGIWPRLLCNTNEPVLFSIGRPQYSTAANVSRFLCTAVGIWVGYSLIGIPGAIIGVALNDLCYYCVVNYGLRREGLGCVRQDVRATALLFGILVLLLGSRYALGFGTPIDQMFM